MEAGEGEMKRLTATLGASVIALGVLFLGLIMFPAVAVAAGSDGGSAMEALLDESGWVAPVLAVGGAVVCSVSGVMLARRRRAALAMPDSKADRD